MYDKKPPGDGQAPSPTLALIVMNLLDITQCKMDLDFEPLNVQSDAMPSIAWNGFLLTGFGRTKGVALNLEGPLPQIIKDCYPNLSFVEISRLIERLEEVFEDSSDLKEEVLGRYNLMSHPEMDDLMGLVLSMTKELQDWMGLLKLTPKDLYPLRAVFRARPAHWSDFMLRFLRTLKYKRATVTQAAKLIDLASQLLLVGREFKVIEAENLDSLTLRLEQLKSPAFFDLQEKVKKIPWPSQVQARWVQDGDSSGIEVRINVKNQDEYDSFLERLEHLSPQLKDKIWKDH